MSIDKRASTIVDYLEEYCNPNSPYFIIQLMGDNTIKDIVLGRKYKHYYKYFGNQNNYFKEKKSKKLSLSHIKTIVSKSVISIIAKRNLLLEKGRANCE